MYYLEMIWMSGFKVKLKNWLIKFGMEYKVMLFYKFFDFFEGYEDCYVIIGGNVVVIWLV